MILILDFGSQVTQLIARRVRECGVYAEIEPCTAAIEQIKSKNPQGIILSGSPFSVYDADAPQVNPEILSLDVPILGICYGLQSLAHLMGGTVEKAEKREFGRAFMRKNTDDPLLDNIENGATVWMSHGDHLSTLPPDFSVIAQTENAIAAIKADHQPIWGVQFHPEVVHSLCGKQLLHNFVRNICGLSGDWTPETFIESKIQQIRAQVGQEHVILGLSGGVDSSVAAVLLHEAIGDQLTCIFIDNGLLRKGEFEKVSQTFRESFGIRLKAIDASEAFLSELKGVSDPETKRKIIGRVFIETFDKTCDEIQQELGEMPEFLAQGTLYPDVIESVSFKGPSVTIKSHHNVGGLPQGMRFSLVEPFRELFKDEVRAVGQKLGVPQEIIGRHPFPGPGLGIRVIGDITKEKLDVLREADVIFLEELKKQGHYDQTWQAFVVLLPVQSVGVMGDGRTYENVCALRAVTAIDGMTADWAHLPHDFLAHVSNRIINEVRGINRVVYDISSKPPATIEWE